MKLRILGNGGAFDELSTSYLINEKILVDCSDAIVHKYALSGQLDKLKHVFFTHRHADHINGFETLIYYFSVKNLNFNKTGLKIYGSADILEYYKNLACSVNDRDGLYRQPFEFIDMDKISSAVNIDDEVFVEKVDAHHMNGTLPCNSYIFSKISRERIIITGDTDIINPLISKEMMDKGDTLLFHDVGWTGLPEVDKLDKYHPREKEVFDFYGYNKNIIGIHTNKELEYYEKAQVNKIYEI